MSSSVKPACASTADAVNSSRTTDARRTFMMVGPLPYEKKGPAEAGPFKTHVCCRGYYRCNHRSSTELATRIPQPQKIQPRARHLNVSIERASAWRGAGKCDPDASLPPAHPSPLRACEE